MSQRKFVIGLSGVIVNADGKRVATMGAGKDTVADVLVEKHYGVKIGMADPLKRIVRDVYAFTDEQLWGSSNFRNEPDERYLRPHTWVSYNSGAKCECCLQFREYTSDLVPPCFLTPRYALRLLGTEWGRTCFPDTWTNLAMETAKKVLADGCGIGGEILNAYDQRKGLFTTTLTKPVKVAVIPDVRFKNEIDCIKALGGKVVRIIRQVPWSREADLHPSESEALQVQDEAFDHVINNDSDLHALCQQADRLMDVLSGRIQEYDPEKENVPPFKR